MEIFTTYPVLVVITSLLINEILKVIFDTIKNRSFSLVNLFKTGGLPSGHAAFVASLIFSVGKIEGIDSVAFMIAVTFGIIVIYDAGHLRAAAGQHAKALNLLKPNLKLEERLGHQPFEVLVGVLVGVISAWFFL